MSLSEKIQLVHGEDDWLYADDVKEAVKELNKTINNLWDNRTFTESSIIFAINEIFGDKLTT